MKFFEKFRNKKKVMDESSELKRGEFKKIILPLMEKHFPDFQFTSYKNQYYSFLRTRQIGPLKIFESFDIAFALKDKICACSVASRLNPFFVGRSGYNTGWINPHCDLISQKRGIGITPLEDAYYYHNGRIETTTRVIHEIISDLENYGLVFLDNQINNLSANPLIIVGLRLINSIEYDITKLKAEIEAEQNNKGHVITRLKHPIYVELKESLQKMEGISRENRQEIPKLAYELIEMIMLNE
ncbi:hypothetical protein GCM10011506_02150 [Marivirga lumbricoides]|uniref:Uncharacterized protein n=1 Tax=Marivirga lumbricoides TaxID=1046115 RepID=A0ABQ1L7G2_9BACT|nr:hypothetical protein GCM10011506_02150 [Marivirga lumbricoides]